MGAIFAGSTPKYLIRIKDKTGVQLDPSDVGQLTDLRIWIFNNIDRTVIAKFYLNTAPDPIGTWRKADVKDVAPGDKRVMFTLTAAETLAAPPNTNGIQIETTIPDTDYSSNIRVDIGSARFPEVKPVI